MTQARKPFEILSIRRLGLALLLVLGALAPAALPATAAASTSLDCTGSHIYAVGRPSGNGVVYSLDASTVGGSSATLTQVTAMPAGSYPNALGVSSSGLYAVDQSGSSANVWTFDAATSTWTSHAGSGTDTSGFVAGAVDPVNGIYYYAAYSGTTGTLYGFDTSTNTAIAGTIGTFTLPGGASGNGDLTFDGAGNMYVLASDGTTRAVGVIHAADVPSTGTNATLPLTVLSSVADSSTYNGIAFDNLGRLYIEGSTGGNYGVTQIDPNDGHTIAGPTAYSTQASAPYVDLASCAQIPTLSANINVSGRTVPSDQFTLSITGGTISQGNTATTSGSTTGMQPQIAGPVIASSATNYTFTETGASGTNLSNYNVTYSCVDGANGNSPVASGSGSSFTLTFPTVTLGQATPPPGIVCSFSTTPKADVALTDSVTPSSAPHGTQVTYTLTATNNGPASATGLTLGDTMPSGVNVVSATPSQGSCSTSSGVSCSLGTLANGGSATVTVVATVSDAASGTQTDSASVTANEYDPVSSNNSASASFTPAPAADLALTDSASPTTVPAGGQVTYTLNLTNGGPDAATAAQILDSLPSGLTVVSATPSQGSCSTSSGVNCALGSVSDGGSVTVTIIAVVSGSASGPLTDAASATAGDADPNQANNSATSPITAVPAADLEVTDSASPGTVTARGQVTYTLTAKNNGPDTGTSVSLTDALPSGMSVVSATPSQGSCSTSSGVSCSLGTIADGASATITLVANVAPGSSGTLTDAAQVSANETDPVSSNNSASAQVNVQADTTSPPAPPVHPPAPTVDVQVVTSADQALAQPGRVITYTITVSDHGSATAPGVHVIGTPSAPLQVLSAKSSQGACREQQGKVNCQLGSIGPNGTVTIVVRAILGRPGSAVLSATADVGCSSAGNCPKDVNPANNVSAASAHMRPYVQLVENVDRNRLNAGATVKVTLRVTNPTSTELKHGWVCTQLPLGLTFVRSARHPKLTNGRLCWTLGTLAAHHARAITFTARALPGAAGVLYPRATAGADGTVSAQARREVTVIAAPALPAGVTG